MPAFIPVKKGTPKGFTKQDALDSVVRRIAAKLSKLEELKESNPSESLNMAIANTREDLERARAKLQEEQNK